jgi:hypothetical protein
MMNFLMMKIQMMHLMKTKHSHDALPPDDDVHATTPPAHENKEMVIFVDGLVKEPLHMVDEHIDTFIQTGRRRWDFGCLIFDRDPIYDIEGTPQEKGFELSSSEDYFSYVYGSYVWSLMMT